jgi:hypothetical protein
MAIKIANKDAITKAKKVIRNVIKVDVNKSL